MKIYRLSQQMEFENFIDGNDLYESFEEVIDDNYEMSIFDFNFYVKKFNLNFNKHSSKIYSVTENDNQIFAIMEGNSFTFTKDPCEWIYNQSESDIIELLGVDESDVYISGLESTLKGLQENLSKAYHYTNKSAWEEIQEEGFLRTSSGTGLGNRYAHGIFASIDPEEYADGTYGEVCLEIDLDKLRSIMGEKTLNIYPEPEVMESVLGETLANVMGVNCNIEHSRDISPFTVIINHVIPFECVSIYGN